jgi:transposase
VSQRKPYPSDLSDARWALIEPTLTAWRKARLDRRPTGQPAKVELRDVFNALLYVNRTGIPWKYLPHDFPNYGTVYAYYAAWRDEGIFTQLNYNLVGLAA